MPGAETVPEPISLPHAPTLADLADEFGEVDRQIHLMKPVVARHKQLRERILGFHSHLAGDQVAEVQGRLYVIRIGAAERQRTVTNPKRAFNVLKKIMGLDALYEALTIPLKLVDRYVPIAEHRHFLKQERTGPRDVTSVAKMAADAGQAAA
jgi:hypothetical protein